MFLSVFLFLIGLILVLLPRVSNNKHLRFLERFYVGDNLSNYFVTIIATLIGVFIAISATNISNDRMEKKKVANLLEVTGEEIQVKKEGLVIYYTDFIKKDEEYSVYNHLSLNVPSYPSLIDTILDSELALNNMSAATISQLVNVRSNLKDILNAMSRKVNNEIMLSYIDIYGKQLKYIQALVVYESRYLNRKITYNEMLQLQSKENPISSNGSD